MKTKNYYINLLTVLLILPALTFAQGVAINTDNLEADPSAMLDIQSNSKGLLIPQMTQSEIQAITNPANGLWVFNTSDNKFYLFIGADNEWKEIAYGSGTNIPIPQVFNPATGRTWMDRNLGASQVATSSTDTAAYGDLYQWGRATDGHESRTSATTSTIATTSTANAGNSWDGLFITNPTYPSYWLTPQDNTLWQGESGTNNPCPNGFRLPTDAEWEAERNSWATNDPAGAFGSPLKLTTGGFRIYNDASITNAGSDGDYWSSIVNSVDASSLGFSDSYTSGIYFNRRAFGMSVRCIKN